MKPSTVLIGPGRVGAAIGRRLHLAGYPIDAVIGRDQATVENAVAFIGCDPSTATTDLLRAQSADILLLALHDDCICQMARRLQTEIGLKHTATLVHFSGMHPASVMAVDGSDCTLVSLHPLLPFADRETAAAQLADCPCTVEGDEQALSVGRELVEAFGGRCFTLSGEVKTLYHAAACVASNYLVTLSAMAQDMLQECGFNQIQARELLAPLQMATLSNLARTTPHSGLTGPVVRGDLGTISQHLRKLDEQPSGQLKLYCQLGQETVALASNSGRLPQDKAEDLRELFAAHLKDSDAG